MKDKLVLQGYITEGGELHVDLPEVHPTGQVTITIEAESEFVFESSTLGEILDNGLVGGWEHIEGDTLEWLEALREARHRRNAEWTLL